MPPLTGPDYYLSQKLALLKGHRRMLGIGRDLLAERYGEAETPSLLTQAEAKFEALIPQIPYIGGAQNSFTDTLVQMTTLLALYRVLERRGVPVAEIGELVYHLGQRTLNRFPAVLRDLAVVVPVELRNDEVRRVILEVGGALVEDALIFDVYTGKPIPEGKKNLAYAIRYRSP